MQNIQQVGNGLNLTWNGLNVVFDKHPLVAKLCRRETKSKKLISNQCGLVSSGELVGFLGASGSGKTTLLNALSFRRVRNLSVSGEIKVNGVKMSREKMLSISAYVQQEDLFIGTLSVREHLMFHAMLRMNRSLSNQEKEAKVEQLMHELMLTKCKNSLIGIPGKLKGISGGEKKRLSFATEILNDPMLLFCDEPTSGLDSAMAYSVVEALKKIASTGKTVLCTIHQPSSNLFMMFDYVYVLYDGNLGLAGRKDDILQFLSQMNMKCPPNYNPADFIIGKLSLKPNTVQQDTMRSAQIVQKFQQSPMYHTILARINMLSQSQHSRQAFLYDYIKYRNKTRAPALPQIYQIFKRNAINFFRDKGLLFMRVFQIILFAVLVGITYLQLDLTQLQSDVINRAVFMAIMCVSLVTALSSIVLYPLEFPTLCKENESRVYSVGSYFIANILFEIPVYAFLTLLFNAINYWIVGLNPRASCFFVSYGWLIIVTLNGLSYGHMLSALTSNPLAAIVVLVPALMYQFVMNEFFLSGASSPLDWLKYTAWLYYSFNLCMINQWQTITSLSGSATTPKSGLDVLTSLNIKTADWYGYMIGLIGLVFVYRFVAFGATYIRIKYF